MKQEITITTRVRESTNMGCKTFVGQVRGHKGDKFIFSKTSNIHRTCPGDATEDASKLKQEMEEFNRGLENES